MDLPVHVFPSWRVCVFWLCGRTKHSSVCLLLQAPCDPKYCAYLLNWSLCLMPVHCCWCAVLHVPKEARFAVFVSVWSILTPLWPKLAEMKAPPPTACLPPVIGQRILSVNSGPPCFVNLQINIHGSACSAGPSGSRPSGKIEERAFGGLQLSLCAALSLAGRTTQMCFVLSQGEQNRTELGSLLLKIAPGEYLRCSYSSALRNAHIIFRASK